jgi:hypothetical protein
MFNVLDQFLDNNLITSQKPATCSYPEPDQTRPCSHIPIAEFPS